MPVAPDPLGAPLGTTLVPSRLGGSEQAVLSALVESAGRVVSRVELARRSGLRDLSERRVDAVIVAIRRVLGADAVRTVRRRGWMLEFAAVDDARRILAGDE